MTMNSDGFTIPVATSHLQSKGAHVTGGPITCFIGFVQPVITESEGERLNGFVIQSMDNLVGSAYAQTNEYAAQIAHG